MHKIRYDFNYEFWQYSFPCTFAQDNPTTCPLQMRQEKQSKIRGSIKDRGKRDQRLRYSLVTHHKDGHSREHAVETEEDWSRLQKVTCPQDKFPYKDLIYKLPSTSKHTEKKNTKVICGRHRIEVIHTIKKKNLSNKNNK